MMPALEQAKAQVQALGVNLVRASEEWLLFQDVLFEDLMSGAGVRALTYGLILLLIGGGVEWLYWSYAHGPLRALLSVPTASPRQALGLGLRQLGLLLFGLLLFTLASLAASSALAWPVGVQDAVVAIVLLLMVLRLAWSVLWTVLSPGRRSRRLAPIDSGRARWMLGALMVTIFLTAFGRIAGDLLEQSAKLPHSAGTLRFATSTLAALILLAASFAFFGRAPLSARARRKLPRLPMSFLVAVLVVAVYGAWLLGSAAASALTGILAIVVVLQIVLRGWVFYFWPGVRSEDEDEPLPATAPVDSHEPLSPLEQQEADAQALRAAGAMDPALVPSIVLSALRFLVALLGLGACAIALDAPLSELATRQGPMMRFVFSLLGVAALALLAHLTWIGIRSSIDQRLRRIHALGDTHGEPSPEARLLTLLPLLRMTSALALGIMLVLSSLWALGIEITPLLAGAGVIGLALGFGAQALVRDVIAGIFFLVEDAFRIGEYIEAGSTTKGTVERITLRTVALRHHNGPLHFVPYGALGTVRNNSRDWVVEKFNIPLPIDVDSEAVRKMIKKIGEEMLQDQEVGHLLREPLKGKLYRVDPGVKIFRCKFETTPGKQFDVRAQAFKRIEAALKAMGVGFADGRQTVLLPAAAPTS